MTRTEIRKKLLSDFGKENAKGVRHIGLSNEHYRDRTQRREFDFLINEIARLQYQINGLRNLNLAPGEFKLSLSESNPYQFTSPEDME